MATRPKLSEAAVLEQDSHALTNAKNQPEIARALADVGYDTEVLNEGETILNATRQAYEANQTEDDETSEAYQAYSSLLERLEKIYSRHRKKAKVIFDGNMVIMDRLNISGALPRAYVSWLETVRRFYVVALEDAAIQEELLRLRVTPEEINECTRLIAELVNARSNYLREKGESQAATDTKNKAFDKLDQWMGDFYKVARIALEDQPQLLEALGKTIKN